MENCKNYLITCAENIILKNRVNQLENGSNPSSLDLQNLEKYYFGKITLSGQLSVQDIQFTIRSIHDALQEFVGKSYESLMKTSSYGIHFPLLRTGNTQSPYVISCTSHLFDETICFILPRSDGNGYEASFYGMKSHNTMLDFGSYSETNNTVLRTYAYLLNALMESSPDGVFILDTKREIQAFNTAGKKILEAYYKKIPEQGELFDHYISPHQLQKYIKGTTEALKGNPYTDEVVDRTPEGKQEWFDYHYHPVFDNSHNVINLLVKFTNKTRARIIERRYYETRFKADETDRLKRAFLNSMSHEIRTPMNGIIGFADLMNRPQLPDEKKQKYAALIKDNSQHLMDAFVEILDLARLESGELTMNEVHFDLNKLFNDLYFYAKNQFLTQRHKNVTFTYHKGNGDDEMIILADKGKIKQIILNLLSNSFRNTLHGYIHFGYDVDENGALNIFTFDSGKGISYKPAEQPVDYHEAGANPSGPTPHDLKAGMGLSILKEYVNFLKGDLDTHTQQGIGSYYSIRIALSDGRFKEINRDSHSKNKIKTVCCAEGYSPMLEPFLAMLAEQYDITHYQLPALKSNQEEGLKVVIFQSDQKFSEIKVMIDTLDPERHLFFYFTHQANEDEKAICYSYGMHEYLSYQMDMPHFSRLLQKYNY